MIGPITRILLRYGAGALAAWGLISSDTAEQLAADPDVIKIATVVVAFLIGVGTEAAYWLAKQLGWRT